MTSLCQQTEGYYKKNFIIHWYGKSNKIFCTCKDWISCKAGKQNWRDNENLVWSSIVVFQWE
jgi:hypothetical protein